MYVAKSPRGCLVCCTCTNLLEEPVYINTILVCSVSDKTYTQSVDSNKFAFQTENLNAYILNKRHFGNHYNYIIATGRSKIKPL